MKFVVGFFFLSTILVAANFSTMGFYSGKVLSGDEIVFETNISRYSTLEKGQVNLELKIPSLKYHLQVPVNLLSTSKKEISYNDLFESKSKIINRKIGEYPFDIWVRKAVTNEYSRVVQIELISYNQRGFISRKDILTFFIENEKFVNLEVNAYGLKRMFGLETQILELKFSQMADMVQVSQGLLVYRFSNELLGQLVDEADIIEAVAGATI